MRRRDWASDWEASDRIIESLGDEWRQRLLDYQSEIRQRMIAEGKLTLEEIRRIDGETD